MFKKGYTTIELLTTLSMIAVLASVMLPSYQAVRTEAKFTRAEAEVKTLQAIVEKYKEAYGQLPEDLNTLKMTRQINITDKVIQDAFAQAGLAYSFEKGRTAAGEEYYIIYSRGENGQADYLRDNERVYNNGDDIIASNLLVVNNQ